MQLKTQHHITQPPYDPVESYGGCNVDAASSMFSSFTGVYLKGTTVNPLDFLAVCIGYLTENNKATSLIFVKA